PISTSAPQAKSAFRLAPPPAETPAHASASTPQTSRITQAWDELARNVARCRSRAASAWRAGRRASASAGMARTLMSEEAAGSNAPSGALKSVSDMAVAPLFLRAGTAAAFRRLDAAILY